MSGTSYNIESIAPNAIKISGTARLEGKGEYLSFVEALRTAYYESNNAEADLFTIDFSELSALNSSGVSSFLFLIQELRNSGFKTPILIAAGSHDWQARTLPNVLKLWPGNVRISKPEGIL